MSPLLWNYPENTVGGGHPPAPATGASPQTSVSGRLGAVCPSEPLRVNFGDGAMCSCGLKVRECSPPSSCKHGRPRPSRMLDALLRMERRALRPTWWDYRDGFRTPRNYLLRVGRRDRLYDAMQKWLYAHDYLRGGR